MKKLWDTKAFSSKPRQANEGRLSDVFSTYFLTILLGIFLLIVVVILALVLWTSNGGSDQAQAEKAFYNPSVSSHQPSASVTQPANSEGSEDEMVVQQGDTLTVMLGEGAGQIAARAGISLDQLYYLNPDKMVGPGGTWWANPGDVVYIN